MIAGGGGGGRGGAGGVIYNRSVNGFGEKQDHDEQKKAESDYLYLSVFLGTCITGPGILGFFCSCSYEI